MGTCNSTCCEDCDGCCVNNGTLGDPIQFLTLKMFPNFILRPIENQYETEGNLLQELVKRISEKDLIFPPKFFQFVELAVFQDFAGVKLLEVDFAALNPPNALTNLCYFIREKDSDDIIILNSLKTAQIGILKNTFQRKNGPLANKSLILKDQYFGAIYVVGKTPLKEYVFCILQVFINLDTEGKIESIQTGYALPIYMEQYGPDVARTSFTASCNNLVGQKFDRLVDQSFKNAILINIVYEPVPDSFIVSADVNEKKDLKRPSEESHFDQE